MILLYHRGTEISDLNEALSQQKTQTATAVQTANNNASAVRTLQEQLETAQDALTAKATSDSKISAQLNELQNEVKNAKASTCLDPSILTVIASVRHMQSGSDSGTARPGNPSQSASGANYAVTTTNRATDPATANKMISEWIANLYAHDSTCTNNMAEVQKINQGASQ